MELGKTRKIRFKLKFPVFKLWFPAPNECAGFFFSLFDFTIKVLLQIQRLCYMFCPLR